MPLSHGARCFSFLSRLSVSVHAGAKEASVCIASELTFESYACNLEACAIVPCLIKSDFPAMSVSNFLDDSESESRAILRSRISVFKYLIAVRLWDTWPVIGDVEAVFKFTDRNRDTGPSMINGIPYEVLEKLLQTGLISTYPAINLCD